MNFFVENAWMIAALPLWVFLIIVFGRNLAVYDSRKISMFLTVGATAIGLVFATFILAYIISNPNIEAVERNFLWLRAGSLNLSVGWLVDNLSAMMLMVVTSVSLLIQIYSYGYMYDDEGFHRFFAYLALFNFSMLGLVLSTNLFQIYIFWELVGLSSYLLIGFWYRKPSAADAAKKAFIMNRIGDFGLLVGIISFLFFTLNWWVGRGDVYLAFTALAPAAEVALTNAGALVFGLIAFAMFLGPVAKSAQFPLHTWLPDAMEGPTPISALIHAATMVAAGVYLIARIYPILELSPAVMTIVAWTGAITALITATIAITQLDIKRVLAYSTCSQLGFMVLAMGVGAYSAGLFHLMTHAYFKAMLFLCSGAVIHGLVDQQDMRYMGGLRKHMPVVAYTYLIGTLAISGIFLSGFWSKEEILSGLASSNNWLLFLVALIIAGMTSFYMFRSYFMTFEGEYRGHGHPHQSSKVMTIPLIILAVPSAIIGFMLSGKIAGLSFDEFIRPVHEAVQHHELLWLPLVSLLVALIGFAVAASMYWDKFPKYVSAETIKNNIKPLYNLSFNKWYIDDGYYGFIRRVFLPVSGFVAWFDKYIVDGFVNLTAYITRAFGAGLRLLQNGNVETYATVLFGGITAITVLIVVYWLF